MSETAVAAPGGRATTRDCLDPWTYVEVRVNGDVAPCCVRGPVGNIAEASLAEILSGEAIRQLRAELATGELDAICSGCRQRAPIAPAALHEKIRAARREVQLPPGFAADAYLRANPDVANDGLDAAWHFRNYGYLEGRPLRPPDEAWVEPSVNSDADEDASAGEEPTEPDARDLVANIALLPITGRPVRRIVAAMLIARRRALAREDNDLVALLRSLARPDRASVAEAVVAYFRACASRAGLLGRLICRSRLDGLEIEAQAEMVLAMIAAHGWRL